VEREAGVTGNMTRQITSEEKVEKRSTPAKPRTAYRQHRQLTSYAQPVSSYYGPKVDQSPARMDQNSSYKIPSKRCTDSQHNRSRASS